jgi:hypothetical protein
MALWGGRLRNKIEIDRGSEMRQNSRKEELSTRVIRNKKKIEERRREKISYCGCGCGFDFAVVAVAGNVGTVERR